MTSSLLAQRRSAMWSRLRSAARAFSQDRSGAVAVLAAVAALVIIPLMGAAFDYTSALAVRSKMQDALDQAVFAGSQAKPLLRDDVARRLYLADMSGARATVDQPSFVTTPDGMLHGSAMAETTTLFLSLANVQTLTVSATSAAKTAPEKVTVAPLAATPSSPAFERTITITIGD